MKKEKKLLLKIDGREGHRAATPLELLYDLVFVVAIANIAGAFHHAYANDHIAHGILSFIMIFISIWWAWNQYTWFASAFNDDSVTFRISTLVQMIGALVLAAGVEEAFKGNFLIITLGYVIIRIPAIFMWLKVYMEHSFYKVTAQRYAIGILIAQIGWVTQSFFEFSLIIFILLFLLELSVPYYAESHVDSNFHTGHIEERFGLLFIIVLGESILASSHGFTGLIEHFSWSILLTSLSAILTLFSLWWLYFNHNMGHKLRNKNTAFIWGYGHLVIFASTAAIGALVSVNIDVLTGYGSIDLQTANIGFSITVALYLFGLWFTKERILSHTYTITMILAASVILLLGLLPHSIITTSILLLSIVIYRQYRPLA